MDFSYFIELLCSGIVKGSIYALIALGYTMVYGIIQLINFAHGEVYMIGAFVALIISSDSVSWQRKRPRSTVITRPTSASE